MKINYTIADEILEVFETIPDLYLILSPELVILTASDPYLKATYKEREKLKGKYLFDVFPVNPALSSSDASSNVKSSLEHVITNKRPHEMAVQRYDVAISEFSDVFEEKYWLNTNTPVLDGKGNLRYIIHKVVDVSEVELAKKRTRDIEEEVLKIAGEQTRTKKELVSVRAEYDFQQERWYHILMQAPAMICILDGPDHKFSLVNPQYQKLVGERPIMGKPIAEAMPELEGQPIFELLDKVYKTGVPFTAHEMVVSLDHNNSGTISNNRYNFTYQPIRDAEGGINGILVFAYEVTHLVEAREKVEQRELNLQDLNIKLAGANSEIVASNEELKLTNEELLLIKQQLQDLNKELEERVKRRTRDLQLAKAQIEADRNRLNRLFMEAPAPMVIIEGEELRFELVNPAYQRIFPGRELLGKPIVEALPELKDSSILSILRNVFTTGETFVANELPLKLARTHGAETETIYWTFTYQARHDENGEIDGVLVFANEVTDQVLARQSVEKNAHQLKLITDAMPVLIGYLDKEEKYRFANQAYEAWFNRDPKELLGQPVRDVVGEKAYSGVKNYIDRALAGERLDFESRMPYREDFVKYIRTSYIPDIHDGKVEGFYTLVNDITEQVGVRRKIEEREKEALELARELSAANDEIKNSNEDLTRLNNQLIKVNSDMDNFIYTASHDLKAPISNIEGLISALTRNLSKESLQHPMVQKLLPMIQSSIERFKKTIVDLTEITKLQRITDEEEKVVNLEDLISNIKLDLLTSIDEAKAEIKLNLKVSKINFSPKNLRSILYNIISNSIKYRSNERKPVIHITTKETIDFNIITISDNGLGIDLSNKNSIFGMFKRQHSHVEGSGIGLYIVKKIIDNAGGKIEVESKVGEGSTFKLYFRKKA